MPGPGRPGPGVPGPCGADGSTASGPCPASSGSGPGAEWRPRPEPSGGPDCSLIAALADLGDRSRAPTRPGYQPAPRPGPSTRRPRTGSVLSVAGAPVTAAGATKHDRPGPACLAHAGQVFTERTSLQSTVGPSECPTDFLVDRRLCHARDPTTPPMAPDGHSGRISSGPRTPAELRTRSRTNVSVDHQPTTGEGGSQTGTEVHPDESTGAERPSPRVVGPRGTAARRGDAGLARNSSPSSGSTTEGALTVLTVLVVPA